MPWSQTSPMDQTQFIADYLRGICLSQSCANSTASDL